MRHLGAIAGYVLLAALLTVPAGLRLGSHIVGYGDAQLFVWELWWFHRAVFELGVNPLVTNAIFHPTPGVPLIWSSAANLLPGMLLVGLFGPVGAYNALVLSGLVIGAVGAYLLALRLVGRRDAAFLGGLIFAFAPTHLAQLTGHLGCMTVQWLPFCVLALWRLAERPTWKRAGLFALSLFAVLISDVYVAGFFLLVLAPTYLALRARHDFTPAFLGRALAAAGAAFAGAAVFLWPSFLVLKGAATDAAQRLTVHRFGQDVLQLLVPPPTHPLFGFLSRPFAGRIVNDDSWGYLGWSVLALAAIAIWRVGGREVRFWSLFSALAIVLSLGTYLHVAGPTPLPLPYLGLIQLPIIQSLRVPGRALEIAALGLGMLAAVGAGWWLTRLGDRARYAAAGLIALVALESFIYFPFPTTSARVPAFYEAIAKEPDAALLEYPNGSTDWGGPTYRWMYYQTAHGKPLVTAHTHRIPNGALDFIERTPFVKRVAYGGSLAVAPAERAHVRAALAEGGISHVILHRVPGMFEGAAYDAAVTQMDALLGPPVHRDEELTAFKVLGRRAPGRFGE